MIDVAVASGRAEAVFTQFETILDALAAEKGAELAMAGVLSVVGDLAGCALTPPWTDVPHTSAARLCARVRVHLHRATARPMIQNFLHLLKSPVEQRKKTLVMRLCMPWALWVKLERFHFQLHLEYPGFPVDQRLLPGSLMPSIATMTRQEDCVT